MGVVCVLFFSRGIDTLSQDFDPDYYDADNSKAPHIGYVPRPPPSLAANGWHKLLINRDFRGKINISIILPPTELMRIPQTVLSNIKIVNDSTVRIWLTSGTETVMKRRQGDFNAKLGGLPDNFEIEVITESDTACFHVDASSDSLQAHSTNQSEFIRAEVARPWPDDFFCVQLKGTDFNLINYTKTRLSDMVDFRVLDEGYYQGQLYRIMKTSKSIGRREGAKKVWVNRTGNNNQWITLLIFKPKKSYSFPEIKFELKACLRDKGLKYGIDYSIMNE